LSVDSAIFVQDASIVEVDARGHARASGRVARLRDAAVAGPGRVGGFAWGPGEREGLLSELVSGPSVAAALAVAGHVDRRTRALPGPTTLALVLALALHSGEGYDSVLAKVMPHLRAGTLPPGAVPTVAALSQARERLGERPVRELFTALAATPGTRPMPGARFHGMTMTGFDGTCIELPRDPRLTAEFGAQTATPRPRARLVTLVSLGDRRILAGAIGAYTTSEQELVDQLTGALSPGTVNLADRNFFSMRRFLAFAATGAHLVWRVKNGSRFLPARVTSHLPDGSYLVQLRESPDMLRTRRKAQATPEAPPLPATTARMIEFDVAVASHRAATRTTRVRLLTTLLDWQAFPARALATLYAERWQVEITFLRLKSTLRGDRTVLRGHSPELVRQELWALMSVYNILCDLAADAAALEQIDPDEISFVTVLRLARSHLATDTPCPDCGHRAKEPKHTLTRAIAASPRNRAGRKRTSPRTPAERKTGHTRKATYTITITKTNLPETDQPTLT
jgi:Insertion element 4 transposase N-terminal/Transposase DDE domain